MNHFLFFLSSLADGLPVFDAGAHKAAIIGLLMASAMMIAGIAAKELNVLKWVGVALAVLSTVFTLVIVGSHLSGRLVGLGKIGIIGTVGAELMAIICAWLATSESKRIAGVAMISQIVLTAVLLVNASIALDLNWQETLADKAAERHLIAQKAAAEQQQQIIKAQGEANAELIRQQAEMAGLACAD